MNSLVIRIKILQKSFYFLHFNWQLHKWEKAVSPHLTPLFSFSFSYNSPSVNQRNSTTCNDDGHPIQKLLGTNEAHV